MPTRVFLNIVDLHEKPAQINRALQLDIGPDLCLLSPQENGRQASQMVFAAFVSRFPFTYLSVFPIFALAFRFMISCQRASGSEPQCGVILLVLCVNGNLNPSGAEGNLQQQSRT